jgi:hypothetical protein
MELKSGLLTQAQPLDCAATPGPKETFRTLLWSNEKGPARPRAL